MKLGYKWDLIIKKNEGEDFTSLDISKFKEVGVEEGKFIADPFLYKKDGVNYVFYELCDYKKGIIVSSIINDDLSLTDTQTVVEFDKHVSFPFLMEFNDELYMIPESCKMGKIFILKCESFPNKWTIVNEIPLSGKDTSVVEVNGVYYMFTTIGNNNNFTILYSDDILGNWSNHSTNNYHNFRSKRNGGKVFKHGDDLIRPTQFDVRDYGESLSFNKISLTESDFQEQEILNLKSNIPNTVGLHHYDFNEDYIIMDVNKKINYDQKKYT